jgi:rod shape-determining protein MreC
MESFLSRYKNPMVLVLVLALQFVVLAVQVRSSTDSRAHAVDQAGVRVIRLGVATVVTPPESVVHSGGLSLREIWAHYIGLVGLKQQNDELKEQVQRLQLEQAALAEDARQGQRLEELLAFKQNYIYSTVPAQVVGGSGTDRSRVLFLDKGSEDGIAVEMPVITPDGIVGKIREVFPHSSQVLVISDPTSAFGALLEETRTRGVVKGNAAGQPQIVNLMPDDRIKPGQKVVTSGGDQIFPRGLPVGEVERIQTDPENEPMVDVVLKPAANLSRLEEVLVVTSTAPVIPPKAKEDLAQSQSVAAGVAAAKAAAEAAAAAKAQQALDAQRASDVLAQRLPGKNDDTDNPDAPDSAANASPTSEAEGAKPLHPPSAVHPDHYTPLTVPSADSLTPGQRYAPLAEGTLESTRPKKAAPAAEGAGAPAETATGGASAPAPRRMITTTLADGTVVTRPAPVKPAVPPGTAGTASTTAPRTVTTTLADGTVVTRTIAPKPAAPGAISSAGTGAATAPRRMVTTTLPDGTVVTRPAPTTTTANASAGGAANPAPRRMVTTTLADGTVVTRPAPATTPPNASANPAPRRIVLPDGTVVTRPAPVTTRPSTTATPGTTPQSPRPATPRIVTDGPLPATTAAPNAATPAARPPVKRKSPELVPDDGSRPPARPAPAAQPGPQGRN